MVFQRGLFFSRTVALDNGHEITVTLHRGDQFDIDTIDLETSGLDDVEQPDGGPYASEALALAAAKAMAERLLEST